MPRLAPIYTTAPALLIGSIFIKIFGKIYIESEKQIELSKYILWRDYMSITYPHQRIININREYPVKDFLSIKNENWQRAARDLKPYGCMLYLYLASNRDKFKLALSPAAVRQAIGMAQSTYRDQFNILLEKGYLVQSGGNTFEFYEVPRAVNDENTETRHAIKEEEITAKLNRTLQAVDDIQQENIEINNKTTFQLPTETNNRESFRHENFPEDEYDGEGYYTDDEYLPFFQSAHNDGLVLEKEPPKSHTEPKKGEFVF